MDQVQVDATGPSADLSRLANRLDILVCRGQEPNVCQVLDDTQAAAEEVGKAWGGSCLGYHANIYYAELASPAAWRTLQSRVGAKGNLLGWHSR